MPSQNNNVSSHRHIVSDKRREETSKRYFKRKEVADRSFVLTNPVFLWSYFEKARLLKRMKTFYSISN
jgi:hypothetical protein